MSTSVPPLFCGNGCGHKRSRDLPGLWFRLPWKESNALQNWFCTEICRDERSERRA